MPRFRSSATTNRHVIGVAEQLNQFDLLAATCRHLADRQIWIVGQNLHAEQALAERGDAAADITKSDDADGLPAPRRRSGHCG